jgi:hypothetical protein
LATAKDCRLADLTIVAFYYLLRSGEYCKAYNPKLTIAFRRKDIRLWRDGHLIPHTAPLPTLLQADSATLYLENQKNSQKGASIHHSSVTSSAACPVRALARIVHSLLNITPEEDAPISLYGTQQHITSQHITKALRQAAVRSGLLECGYTLDRISAHSLRAGGAMALKLANYDEALIKKIGRWSSDTWLTYIHSQIACLTTGIAERMAVTRIYQVVGI